MEGNVMDALEFLRERKRMCNLCKHCEGCPLKKANCALDPTDSDEDCKRIISIVEQWSKEHPRKTRQSVFLEQYPEAQIDDNDVLSVCPAVIHPSYRKDGGGCLNIHKRCADCRREFWMQEVE
jgi:hypothetical protein